MSEKCCENPNLKELKSSNGDFFSSETLWCKSCGSLIERNVRFGFTGCHEYESITKPGIEDIEATEVTEILPGKPGTCSFGPY